MNSTDKPDSSTGGSSQQEVQDMTPTTPVDSSSAGADSQPSSDDMDVDSESPNNKDGQLLTRPSYLVEGIRVPLGNAAVTKNKVNDTNNVRKTVPVNTFQENAESVERRLKNCQIRLDELHIEEGNILVMEVNNEDDLKYRKFKLAKLAMDIEYFKKQSVSASDLLSHLREHSVKDITSQTQLMSIREVIKEVPKKKDHTAISPKDLPLFNIKTNNLVTNDSKSDAMSLDVFIRKFERVYLNNDVDVHEHWYFHLEACLEKNDLNHIWFDQNVKAGYLRNKSKYSWEYVKEMLKQRFDIGAKASLIGCNQKLYGIRQGNHEQLAEYMDRFSLCVAPAKVNTKNNFFFTGFFLGSLFTNDFQEKVQTKLYDFMKAELYQLSSKRSIHATDDDNDFYNFYGDFDKVTEAIRYHVAYLEEACAGIQKAAANNVGVKKDRNVKSYSVANTDFTGVKDEDKAGSSNQKKRKINRDAGDKPSFQATNCNFVEIENPDHVLNEDEKKFLLIAKKCLGCRTKPYSYHHAQVCPYKKKSTNKVIKNNNDVAVLSNEICSSSSSINIISDSSESEVNKEDPFADVKDLVFSDSDDEDEFQAALKELDNFVVYNNFEINDKNVFSVYKNICLNNFAITKRGVIGDDENNPFNSTDNAAYSPVSPIIINSVKTYCTLDSGAQVSVLNKKFAIDNNIKFHKIDGCLVLADGSKIDREQTVDYLSIDYDGVNKTILHKFDVIDNNLLSNSNQILVGIDLMPQLTIHLVNVAYKYKDATAESVDAIDENQAFIPNVTPYGSEKRTSCVYECFETLY